MNAGRKRMAITVARISLGYRQEELAKEICRRLKDPDAVTANLLSKIENGWKKTVPESIAKTLGEVLKLTLEEINGG